MREQGGSDFPAAINMFQFSHPRGVGAHIPPTAGNRGGSAPSVESVFGSDGRTAYGRTPLGNLSLAPPISFPIISRFQVETFACAVYLYPSRSSPLLFLFFCCFPSLRLFLSPTSHFSPARGAHAARSSPSSNCSINSPLPLLPPTASSTTTTATPYNPYDHYYYLFLHLVTNLLPLLNPLNSLSHVVPCCLPRMTQLQAPQHALRRLRPRLRQPR